MTLRQQFDKAVATRDYSSALALLDDAVPQDVHPHLYYQKSAQIHEQLGAPDVAAQSYVKLIETNPKNAKYWDQAGRFHYRIGDGDTAADHIEKAIELSGGKVGCKKTLLASYRRAKNGSRLKAYLKALADNDNPTPEEQIILAEDLLHNGRSLNDAKAYFDAGYERSDQTEKLTARYGSFQFKLAHLALKKKDWDLTFAAFATGLKYLPNDYKQYLHYARALAGRGKVDAARSAIEAADKIAPEGEIDSQAAMIRTQIYETLGDIDKAAAAYEVVLETKPDDAKAWDQVGRFYFRHGFNDKAVSRLQKALDISDGQIGCKKTLIAAMRRLGVKSDVEKSIEAFKEQSDKTAGDYYTIADILAGDMRTYAEARTYFEYGLEMDETPEAVQGKYASLLNKVAQQANRKGDLESARKNYEACLEIEPKNYRNMVRYVSFLVKQEDYDRAYDILQDVKSVATSKDLDHLPYLGATELRKGNPKAAKKAFLKSYKKDERNTEASLMRLADVETALGNHKEAANYLKKLNKLSDSRVANRERRIHIHNLLQEKYNPQDKKRMDTCVTYFQRNLPKLDEEQQRILDQLIDRGICMSDFDSLFGKQHQELWDKAEQFVQNFANDPETLALQKRISECEDFNADPEFSGSFKPSIINYRLLKGEMYATEAAYQLYLNKRILDITNSYNEMLSRIRNVALWVNPPIGGKNIGERKGSQIWHRDQEDANILKCFIYYTDIDESSGATEYIPYSKVKPVRKYSDILSYPNSSGYPGSYLIDSRVAPEDMLKAEGKKKSIMFFDTNGFHRGGYVTGDRRILTMATFLRPITPYADTNTKLSTDGFDEDAYPFEAAYGVQK